MSQSSSPGACSAATHTGLLITLTIIAALGGLLFGYDTAVISGATDSIKQNFVAPLGLAEGARISLEGFTIAGALWGCLIGGAARRRPGALPRTSRRPHRRRRVVLHVVAGFGLAGIVASASSGLGADAADQCRCIWFLNLFFDDAPYTTRSAKSITNFIGHRIFGGMGIGLASMLAPMYIAEIAPPSKRGALVTYQQIAIVSGITLVVLRELRHQTFGWRRRPELGARRWAGATCWLRAPFRPACSCCCCCSFRKRRAASCSRARTRRRAKC